MNKIKGGSMQQITLSVNKFNCKSSAILESDLGDADDIIYKLFRREGGGICSC